MIFLIIGFILIMGQIPFLVIGRTDNRFWTWSPLLGLLGSFFFILYNLFTGGTWMLALWILLFIFNAYNYQQRLESQEEIDR